MNAQCRICRSTSQRIFDRVVLQRHNVSYFSCPKCGFIQTDDPYWLNEAYTDPLSVLDTGMVARNFGFLPRVSSLLLLLGLKERSCLDVGGGCGLFTRLMRDVGF